MIASTHKIGIPHGFSVTWPEDETSAYSIGYWEDGPQEPNRSATDARIAYIDQYTAEPIGEYGFDQYGWAGKATSFGIAVHEGRQWGLINQILVTIAVLAILLSVATSMVMWRKRRPKGIGAPRREPNRKLGLGLLLIIALLGILFPLLGATSLLVLSPRPGSQPMERPSGYSSARAIYGEVSWEQVIPGRDAQRAQRRSGAR
ncbi:MAG: PepSY domain-containing protein, partial [Pseudonocardiaceae bacterium]